MKTILFALMLVSNVAGAAGVNQPPGQQPATTAQRIEKAALAISAFMDLRNGNEDLKAAKTFIVDRDFVRAYAVDFSLFMDDSASICFRGSPAEALKILGDIMVKSHREDNSIVPSQPRVTPEAITQPVSLTDEGGPHDINVLIKRCK